MDISFEESPIFMTRLVDDSGWSMTGGPMPTGSRVAASWRRSCTSWRAWTISVPCLKMRTIEDIAITVLDLMVSISGVALSVSSMGTVISSSTSWVVIPMPSVWISTRGGANSGKTSTGRSESSAQSQGQHGRGDGDDEVPKPQARADDPAKHIGDALSAV